MHTAQKTYCKEVKKANPDFFVRKKVLDVGSLDINGNNRYLFLGCDYLGLDIVKGKNVDVISNVHEYETVELFDTIISTEMLEHDKHWQESILAMYNLLNNGGLLLITCATTGRKEHGTTKNKPRDSPFTNDYYKNITWNMFEAVIEQLEFRTSSISINNEAHDLYFYGIKK